MKGNRFLSILLAGLMLFSILSVFPSSMIKPFSMMEASAAEGRLYNQNDSYWKTVVFTKYSSSGSSMYSSGCGIFSFCNAIYALNGNEISAENLAAWAVDNGSYQPGNGGLYRQAFYNNIQSAYGSEYGFTIDGQFYGTISDSRLISHLQRGGVATVHVSNHFLAVTGYNASNGTYHVIESAVYSGRGLQADSWVSASKLSSGSTDVDWYALISNTQKTGKWYDDLMPANIGDQFCALVSNATTGGYLHNEGWNVAAYPGDLSNRQAWIFNRQSDNSYVIASAYDTNRLTVYNHEDNNCASIIVTYDEIDECQKWYVYQIDGNYVLRPSHSDKVMDLSGGGTAAGTNIQIYDYNSTTSQQFKIEKRSWTEFLVPDNPGYDFCAKIYNNTTGGHLQNDGWNVAAYNGTNDLNQIWHFSRQSDGSFIITSVIDGTRLMPYNGGIDSCTNITVTSNAVSEYQRWYVYFTNRGYFLRPVYCDKVMDVAVGGYDSGTNVQLYDFNSTYAQYYEIEHCDLSFALNFDSNGGTCSTSSKTVTYASKYGELPEPSRSGYTFNGWYTAQEGGDVITSDMTVSVASIQTLYAQWTPNQYTLTIDPNGGTYDGNTSPVIHSPNLIYGTSNWWAIGIAQRDGYTLNGYFTEASGGTMIYDATGSAILGTDYWTSDTRYIYANNLTVYAQWEKNQISGDVNSDGQRTVADVVMLQKWLLDVGTLTDSAAADLNEDGLINGFDLAMLKHLLLHK